MEIEKIEITKLTPHPDNPNRITEANFRKLKRHIKNTAGYEPLIVRKLADGFQIINGHHRARALAQLGYKTADCLVWDVDDNQTDILLMTLNRLGGKPVIEKKIEILKRLQQKSSIKDLSKLLSGSAKQIQALQNLKLPDRLPQIDMPDQLEPMVFFLTKDQKEIIEKSLGHIKPQDKTLALVKICQSSLENKPTPEIKNQTPPGTYELIVKATNLLALTKNI